MSQIATVTTSFNSPTVLGSRVSASPQIGGTIRPGIKVLTQSAENVQEARELYEHGCREGKNFDDIETEIKKRVPSLKNPLKPTNVPYFTVRSGDFPMPEIADLILNTFGEDRGDGVKRLYRFPVIFPMDALDAVMPHTLKCYGSSKLKYWAEFEGTTRKCMTFADVPKDPNSKRVIRLFGGRKHEPRAENGGICDPERCKEYQSRQCNLDGKLLFIIPGMPTLSLISLPTRSFYSLSDIRSTLERVFMMRGRVSGYLAPGKTFWVTKVYKEVTRIDDNGDPVRGGAWLISLEADLDLGGMLLEHEMSAHRADQAAQALQGQPFISTASTEGEPLPAADEREPGAPADGSFGVHQVKSLRSRLFEQLQALGVEAETFSQFAVKTWSNEHWSRTQSTLEKAVEYVQRLENLHARLKHLLTGMDIPIEHYAEYAPLRFHRDDWALIEEVLFKAVAEVESFLDSPDEFGELIRNEIDNV